MRGNKAAREDTDGSCSSIPIGGAPAPSLAWSNCTESPEEPEEPEVQPDVEPVDIEEPDEQE